MGRRRTAGIQATYVLCKLFILNIFNRVHNLTNVSEWGRLVFSVNIFVDRRCNISIMVLALAAVACSLYRSFVCGKYEYIGMGFLVACESGIHLTLRIENLSRG